MKALIIWNIIVFVLYGIDKWKAMNGKWRISERALLILVFLMGGFGAFLGMQVFRHKTRKIAFIIMIPLAMLENLAILYFFGRYFL